jgi:hypothetical protein
MLLCLLVAAARLAHSASPPQVTTIGAGGDDCRKWTQAIKEPAARYQYRQWIFGFVSGYNWRDASKQVVPPDSSALLLWVDEFCRVNPDAPLYVAAGNLAKSMAKAPPPAKRR